MLIYEIIALQLAIVFSENPYRRAVQAIRGERNSLFERKRTSKSVEPCCWSHKFTCLSSASAQRVPCTQAEKMVLEEAGLGEKLITIPNIDCTAENFNKLLVDAFPKLKESGGFELLRCKTQSRDLILISPRIASNARLLKRRIGNGRVYIRPIQRSLGLEAVESDDVEGVRHESLNSV